MGGEVRGCSPMGVRNRLNKRGILKWHLENRRSSIFLRVGVRGVLLDCNVAARGGFEIKSWDLLSREVFGHFCLGFLSSKRAIGSACTAQSTPRGEPKGGKVHLLSKMKSQLAYPKCRFRPPSGLKFPLCSLSHFCAPLFLPSLTLDQKKRIFHEETQFLIMDPI